jgi:hypothetical protein
VAWTIVGSHEEAGRFADAIAARPVTAGTGTSISTGLLAAARLLTESPTLAQRRVIDVSGDGPNNAGPPVSPIRDRLVASGITINGLPISLPRGAPDAFESFGEPYLDAYFENCVIGGPDAFVIGINDMSRFEAAILRKLIREIAGDPARFIPVAYRGRLAQYVDCLALGQAPGR